MHTQRHRNLDRYNKLTPLNKNHTFLVKSNTLYNIVYLNTEIPNTECYQLLSPIYTYPWPSYLQ